MSGVACAVCGVCWGWWCELSGSRSCPYVVTLLASLESWIHFKWGLPPLLHRWQHLVTKYTTHVTDRDTINKLKRLVSRFGECVVLILLREAKIFHRANDICEIIQQFVSISPLFSSNGWNLYFKISEKDWWMSIFYTCVNFNRTERSAKMLSLTKRIDDFSLRISNVSIFRWTVRKTRKYSDLWPRMCQNVPGAPGLSRDTGWHVTLHRVASVTVSWVRACVHNQVPLSPAQPQVARQNILWEQGSLESGDLTVGVLIKLNFIWLQRGEIVSRDRILCLWCPEETSLKWNYHFCLFQREIIMFSLTFVVCQHSKSVNFMMRK